MIKENKAILSTCSEYLRSLQMDYSFSQPILQNDPDSTVVITGLDEKIYNSIFVKHPSDPQEFIDEVIAIKHALKKPLTIWITAETNVPGLEEILKNNFESPGPFYGMLLELSKANLSPCPEKVTIEQVKNPEQANAYAKIFSHVFNFPKLLDHTAAWAIEQYEKSQPNSINYIARIDGVLAGVSSLILDKSFNEFNIGGFYNACVLPEFRKSGIGTAMACHRIHEAKKFGLEYLSILLMSNAMARSYCEKIGFKNHHTMTPYYIL